MNHNAAAFVLTELLLAMQFPVWVFYTQEWLGAIAAVVGMFVAWLLFRWSEQ